VPSQDEIQAQLDEWQIHDRGRVRREIEELPNILWGDETIERVVQGMYEGGSGLLVGTNKRLVFINKGFSSLKVEDFPYDKITSIQYSTGMINGEIKVFASGNKTEIKNVPKRAARDFAEAVRARVSAIAEPATSSGTQHPHPPMACRSSSNSIAWVISETGVF
jgi:Bacterial PH domain